MKMDLNPSSGQDPNAERRRLLKLSFQQQQQQAAQQQQMQQPMEVTKETLPDKTK